MPDWLAIALGVIFIVVLLGWASSDGPRYTI